MIPSSNTSEIYNDLITCPIGLFYKCACYINETLSRNVGSFDNEYDGFGLPIGSMVETHYTIDNFNSWFSVDEDKLAYKNYIDYVQDMYLNASITNLFENNAEAINPETIILDTPSVDHYYDLVGHYNESLNDNLWDTKTGRLNHYYLSNDLVTSSTWNTMRNTTFDKSITYGLFNYLGLNESTESNIFTRFYPNQRGRIEIGLNLEGSPVYPSQLNSSYGNVRNFNFQEAWINSLSNSSLRFLGRSLMGDDLVYSEFFEDISSTSEMMSAYNQLIGAQSYFGTVVTDYETPYPDVNSPVAKRRYNINGTPNSTIYDKFTNVYAEAEFTGNLGVDANIQNNNVVGSFNEGIAHGQYQSNIASTTNNDTSTDLIAKTNQAFKEGSYRTLISRFHTSDKDETFYKEGQSAISKTYGMSHGRNLLKIDETRHNGYINPYCRVWTYHYQYSKLANAIRPFSESSGDGSSATVYTQDDLAKGSNTLWKYMANQFGEGNTFDNADNGRSRLGKYTVLNKNGMVNIAPTNEGEDSVDIKNCMFSIENLAWKDFRDGEYGLSPEQRGSMGGRIMWFPPYDLKFNEQVRVNWNENSFIGRGENVYTYMNTARTGNLSFKLLIDHPSIIDYFNKDEDAMMDSGVDSKDSKEQQLLRFFAGCDLLVASPNQIGTEGTIDNIPQLPEQPVEEAPEVPTETITKDAQVIFYVFYPNNYSGVDDAPGSGTVSAMPYLANGLGTQLAVQSGTSQIVEFAPSYEMYSNDYGGYEVGLHGVSTVNDEVLRNVPKTEKPVLNGVKSGRHFATVDGIELCTQYVQPNNFNGTSEWYYRVDRVYQGQKLLKGNYVDNQNFGLNEFAGLQRVKNEFISPEDTAEIENTYSFIDVFCALDSKMYDLMTQRHIVHKDSYKKLKNLFDTYKIKSVQGNGMASSHGYNDLNNTLNQNRYNSVVKWLRTYSIFDGVESVSNNTDIGDVTTGQTKTTSVNDMHAKLYRSAKVIINLQKEEVVTLQETESTDDESVTMGDSGMTYNTKYGEVHVPKKIMDSINKEYTTQEARQKAVEQMLLANPYQFFETRTPEFENALKAWQQEARGVQKQIDKLDAVQSSMQRYDNEANFFKTLPVTSPFLHNLIKEKIQYFDPAFHSISPEGFNARLTFLQQCCRQGSTYSANENGMNTGNATNLAFGTPPVCVLRIGDFFCTKIIIENMNIDYELWDLNPEGIGVQPMVADIQLSFVFLGGQDLSNPIPRLQNALSFNYYKNTSVYDNRAEMAIYDSDNNGELIQFRGIKH